MLKLSIHQPQPEYEFKHILKCITCQIELDPIESNVNVY